MDKKVFSVMAGIFLLLAWMTAVIALEVGAEDGFSKDLSLSAI